MEKNCAGFSFAVALIATERSYANAASTEGGLMAAADIADIYT